MGNKIFSALCSISKQTLSKCKFMSQGEIKSAFWKPLSASSPVCWVAGGIWEASDTFAISYSKQRVCE